MPKQFLDYAGLQTYHTNIVAEIPTRMSQLIKDITEISEQFSATEPVGQVEGDIWSELITD